MLRSRRSQDTVWTFTTGQLEVSLMVTQDYGYQYDGDDEDGETQAKLDSGEYVAFDSIVEVRTLEGTLLGSDHLGGSVYASDTMSKFWQSHRTSPPEYRNTLAMQASGHCIGHYFPDMVRTACTEARAKLRRLRSIPVRGEV